MTKQEQIAAALADVADLPIDDDEAWQNAIFRRHNSNVARAYLRLLSVRPEVDALDLPGTVKLAIWFHETYEELAPLYGYETRPESRTFDASSPNGKLMLAVCRKLRERYAFSPQKE